MSSDTCVYWLPQVSLDCAVCDIGVYQQRDLKYYTCLMQYYELAYLYYTGYYALASALLLATLISAFLSTAKLHEIRLELFKSVDKRGITPLVQHGRVRSCTALATNLPPVTIATFTAAACALTNARFVQLVLLNTQGTRPYIMNMRLSSHVRLLSFAAPLRSCASCFAPQLGNLFQGPSH